MSAVRFRPWPPILYSASWLAFVPDEGSAPQVLLYRPPVPAKRRRPHHSVYVVLLSRDVTYEPKFKRCNPDRDQAKPCVYVGMTGLDPDDRFDKHKAGIRSNKYVRLYGLKLLPELYERYNPMPYDAAKTMEVELGIRLREAGYGVWQA